MGGQLTPSFAAVGIHASINIFCLRSPVWFCLKATKTTPLQALLGLCVKRPLNITKLQLLCQNKDVQLSVSNIILTLTATPMKMLSVQHNTAIVTTRPSAPSFSLALMFSVIFVMRNSYLGLSEEPQY